MRGIKIPQQDFALKMPGGLCARGGGGGELMRGIKIPQQDFALKMPGGLCARGGGGGAYLRDTTVVCMPILLSVLLYFSVM